MDNFFEKMPRFENIPLGYDNEGNYYNDKLNEEEELIAEEIGDDEEVEQAIEEELEENKLKLIKNNDNKNN